MATKSQVQELADRLISTLDSGMDPVRADAIVRDVAEALYREVLGIPGQIVHDDQAPHGIVHGGFGPNGKKAAMMMGKYKYERTEEKA